jgi:hypothetical protein
LPRGAEIYKAIKEAHYVTVAKKLRREACLRLGEWTNQKLTPTGAMKKYTEIKNVPEEPKKALLDYGERLGIGGWARRRSKYGGWQIG